MCTLRSGFVHDALPDEVLQFDIPYFEHDTSAAIRDDFKFYKIDSTDAELPLGLLQHPLTLRMFCEVTNPERSRAVGVEHMPDSLTRLFDQYLDQVAERISELAPAAHRYYASDVRTALSVIGLTLWEEKTRSVEQEALRCSLSDQSRRWITTDLAGAGGLESPPINRIRLSRRN